MAIGSAFPKKLRAIYFSVDGKIAAEEVLVDLDEDWPDYVFKDDYTLLSLAQVKRPHRSQRPPAQCALCQRNRRPWPAVGQYEQGTDGKN